LTVNNGDVIQAGAPTEESQQLLPPLYPNLAGHQLLTEAMLVIVRNLELSGSTIV
jgi:hypothetical protein